MGPVPCFCERPCEPRHTSIPQFSRQSLKPLKLMLFILRTGHRSEPIPLRTERPAVPMKSRIAMVRLHFRRERSIASELICRGLSFALTSRPRRLAHTVFATPLTRPFAFSSCVRWLRVRASQGLDATFAFCLRHVLVVRTFALVTSPISGGSARVKWTASRPCRPVFPHEGVQHSRATRRKSRALGRRNAVGVESTSNVQ